MSATIALVVVKYGFPLFERELIQAGENIDRPKDTWTAPLILVLFYSYALLHFIYDPIYQWDRFWLLWSSPCLLTIFGGVVLWLWGPSTTDVRQACKYRAARYKQALGHLEQGTIYNFYQRLMFTTIFTSLFFLFGLLYLNVDDPIITALKFQFVVGGFLLAMHLTRIVLSQNIAAVLLGDQALDFMPARVEDPSPLPSEPVTESSFGDGNCESRLPINV